MMSLTGAPTHFNLIQPMRIGREVSQMDACSLSFSRLCGF